MSQPNSHSQYQSNTSVDPSAPNIDTENNNNHTRTHFPTGTFTSSMAKTYNQRTGGCNIIVANHLLALANPSLTPSTQPLRILDNACGPLVLTTQILLNPAVTSHKDIHISAVDLSPDFIAANHATIASPSFPATTLNSTTHSSSGGGVKVDTAIMDGTALDFPDATFDLSFTSLALFAFPDPVLGARELHRTLKSPGVTAAATWKSVGWLPLLHEVETLLKPGQPHTQFPFLEPWSVPGKLSSILREGGFERVEEREVDVVAWWGGVAEAAYWITATLRMMVGQGWSEGEKEEMEEGLRRVLEGEGSQVMVKEGERVGFPMVAFVGVGWK